MAPFGKDYILYILLICHCKYSSILYHFGDKARLLENRDFLYPIAFKASVKGVSPEYCHTLWCGKRFRQNADV